MKLRGRRGGTLGVIIVCAITIVLLGVCFFFLAKIFGGERELVSATDAGILNVAKQAISLPGTNLSGAEEADNFGGLGDSDGNRVSLATYNRLYAQALVIALNAERDDAGDNKAKNHAKQVMDALQTGGNSIGGRLSTELSKNSGNVLFSQFDATAGRNSTRMLGKGSAITRQDADFDVAYMDQRDVNSDGATNIEVPAALQAPPRPLFPSELLITIDGKQYLRGYAVPGLTARPIGVPVGPHSQPHRVSKTDFDRETDRHGPIAFSNVPPNAFKARVQASEEKTGGTAEAISYAKVGIPSLVFKADGTFSTPSPKSYFEVVNGPLGGSGQATPVPPPFANLNNWLANEALTGTPVCGKNLPSKGLFARRESDLDAWASFVANQQRPAADRKAIAPPPTTDIFFFTNRGRDVVQATQTSITSEINFTPQNLPAGGPPCGKSVIDVLCLDSNSPPSNDMSTVNSQCNELYNNGAFDKGFHNGGGYQDNNKPPATNLMSVECAKCRLQGQFNACGGISVDGCGATGLRLYTCSSDMPSASMGNCRVSNEGDALALANQVQAGFGSTCVQEMTFRLKQALPSLTEADVQSKLQSQRLNLGDKYFLYSDGTNLQYSKTVPPGFSGENPDSRSIPATPNTYSIDQGPGRCGFVNPHHDGDIHDIMYREGPVSSSLQGKDTATLQLSSGYKNFLGRLIFTNEASGSATGFCKPD